VLSDGSLKNNTRSQGKRKVIRESHKNKHISRPEIFKIMTLHAQDSGIINLEYRRQTYPLEEMK
jgi:hypothetical protein